VFSRVFLFVIRKSDRIPKRHFIRRDAVFLARKIKMNQGNFETFSQVFERFVISQAAKMVFYGTL
jgi:hypothetical protein